MDFREYIKDNIVILDGGMGTLLQSAGLEAGECSEEWSLSHPEEIIKIHKAYFDAGSNVVNANTFGVNTLKYTKKAAEGYVRAAFECARKAAETSDGNQRKFVALDIGSMGRLLKPIGDLDFEDAVSAFADMVKLGVKYGADLVTVETMTDAYETKAALLAVKENSDLPVIVTNAYGADGKLLTGAVPEIMTALLEGMGADVIGVNCSLGPKALEGVINKYLERASVPVAFKPNAGLPVERDGKTVYDIEAEEFSDDLANAIKNGVRLVGGCCGTTPEYIKLLAEKIKDIRPAEITRKNFTTVTSYAKWVDIGNAPVLIGERINPTGKKKFRQALIDGDVNYILNEAVRQEDAGAKILDVNVGIPDIDEKAVIEKYTSEIQAVTALPLQIDTSDAKAMEAALRRYNGKAMINSVNGKKESMKKIFPLVKKYGGTVVALTLDENGIPTEAEGRIKIAKKILKCAAKYGIDKKDIVFDTLCLTVSADTKAALATLGSMEYIRNKLGCNTVLGVSNISFGLPQRDNINSTFFACAMEKGLSAAIMNPFSYEMMKTYKSFCALHDMDESCMDYIYFCTDSTDKPDEDRTVIVRSELYTAIVKGMRDNAAQQTAELLKNNDPLEIVNKEIIPALDEVGKGFEKNKIFLPSLLMSAEAAGYAFEKIKAAMAGKGGGASKCAFVLATVKGDIHDIGKNIVKLLLENYGYNVIDLGKDVPPEKVVEAVLEHNAPFAGLSALMTTTVPAMAETVALIHEKAPFCKVVVGGAVLNEEFARKIHADKYAPDAMATVRYAEENR